MRTFIALGVLALLYLGVYGDSSDWWKAMSLYQIYPRSFKDSDGDGIGDLKGVESKLEHLVDTKIDAFWLSPIYPSPMVDFGYDISDFKGIDPVYGTMQDFEDLVDKAHKLNLKVIMDFVPNHSSNKHEWFQNSVRKIEPYTDYYMWHPGKIVNGSRQPPNNWVNVFYGSAWTWNEERQEYYLHQFAPEQPDFNYRNEKVVEEMKDILRFWLDKGVDGFRIDAIPHLYEIEDLRDEPLSGTTSDPKSYGYTIHMYTNALRETYEMVSQWRDVMDEYENKGDTRIIVIEAYANMSKTMDYYLYRAHFPFNFGLITSVEKHSKAESFKKLVDTWTDNLPVGAVSNWVAGNHDKSRLVTRYGRNLAPALQIMVHLLPGVAVTYNGEEIGMEDTWLSWEETQDPQGCNAGKGGYEKSSRDKARTPFQWDNTVSAGFSTNPNTWLRVNENFKHLNLAAQKAADKSYYKTFLKITELRKLPAVNKGSLQTRLLNDDVFAFSRELEGETSVYVVINFGYSPETVSLQAFEKVPDDLLLYVTTSDSMDIQSSDSIKSTSVQINPRSGAVFLSKN
ncbi:alpha-glucosidase-like [Copidosoma floridanum]|uniref:alpha-glucosidase-like n=1 Tax=Copidosoma floridanum TaxID=29053 RepID=UPI0006C9D886|nr:alpha-glucosidase-like [Copidosoma floridanum]